MSKKNIDWEDEFDFDDQPSDNKELVRFIGTLLRNWYWFVLCAIISMGGAYLYLRKTVPVYSVHAQLLVSDEKKGGGSLAGSPLGDLSSLMGAKNSVDNEVEVLSTYDLMEAMVLADSSYISYFEKKALSQRPVYQAPFHLTLHTDPAKVIEGTSFTVKNLGQDQLELTNADTSLRVEAGKPFALADIGLVQIDSFHPLPDDATFGFTIRTLRQVVSGMIDALDVSVTNKLVSTIDLTLHSSVPRRGEEQLQELIAQYMERNLHDKNVIADSTLSFINARLSAITLELAGVEDKISGYKQSTQLADMAEQSRILLENSAEYTKSLAEIDVQLSSLDAMSQYLRNPDNPRVVPATVMIQDMAFNAIINRYNELVLQRERLLLANTEDNPLVKNIDTQIAGVREDMISSLASTRRNLELSRSKQAEMAEQLTSQIQRVPTIERGFIDLARLQQIKQAQYIFLQEKWEETAISRTANVANAKVIDSPRAGEDPISPKTKMVYAIGLVLGLLFPLGVIYLRNVLNVRIQTLDDVTRKTSLSVLGMIAHADSDEQVVVSKTSRAPIAEQFRALRTNLEFALQGGRRILFTSSMSGEGKSYIALNLAVSLALLDKKVLIMEMDLRKPSITSKLGLPTGTGFSQYIVRPEMHIDDIITPSGAHDMVDLIQAGAIPPNPAELLVSHRAELLMHELGERYDYILMDAPPVGMVTDAQLLARYADVCLYLIRQGHTYKEQLMIPNELAGKEKIKPIHLVINDVQAKGRYFNNYGYGYGYGDYGQMGTKKRWWKLRRK